MTSRSKCGFNRLAGDIFAVRCFPESPIPTSLFLGRKRQQLVLLHNNTEVGFITGDQPVINLHGGNRPKPPTKLSMYYPISPTAALIWGEVDEEVPYSTSTLTAGQVSAFNARIAAEAHSQLFCIFTALSEAVFVETRRS